MKQLIIATLSLFMVTDSFSQDNPINTGFGIGYQLVQYQQDFGFGLNLTSPMFAGNNIGVRIKGNVMYNQNVVSGKSRWMQYGNVSLGMIGTGGHINDVIRLYGEGGVILIVPSSQFSSESTVIGGYGNFGFEFFFAPSGNYFIEIGGMGTGATADKITTAPIYSNGLTVSTGIRFFFR